MTNNLIAQAKATLIPVITNPAGLGGYVPEWDPTKPNYKERLAVILSNVIGFLTIVAGLWFMIQFILGAVSWISAGGDKGKTTQAKDKLTESVIGLAIVVGAYAIAGLIGVILGLDFLNIGAALSIIKP